MDAAAKQGNIRKVEMVNIKDKIHLIELSNLINSKKKYKTFEEHALKDCVF